MPESKAIRTVIIFLPEGYKDAVEFCIDCGFELAEPYADGMYIVEAKDGAIVSRTFLTAGEAGLIASARTQMFLNSASKETIQ